MTILDPFKIAGPALISFSGGRTSGYMLHRILQAHAGTLPDDIKVCFANTGKEMPQTLDFVRDCGERWNVEIVWLEYIAAETPADRWKRVDYATAAREGEPFTALINKKNYLPNPVTRFCTQELKINLMQRWSKACFVSDADRVLGLRADEPQRVARIRAREQEGKDAWDVRVPLFEAGLTKADVVEFWRQQNFGLALLNINGSTPLGNCDLCFLKAAGTISRIMREMPELAEWWIETEAGSRASKPSGARFRLNRPSYAEMLNAVQRQDEFDFGEHDALTDCFCGDGT